jgi:protein O-mannosyl-transferase
MAAVGIILLAALLVYHNSFTVPFLLDDFSSVRDNAQIRHLWPIWKVLSPPATLPVGGRPVINLSFAINYAVGELAVRGYHILNLTIHVLAGLTLLGIVRRTFLQPVLRDQFGPSALPLALAVAVLWTIHPLQTETVTYISERCESLMGLFYMLTLYCFIRGTDSENLTGWLALSVIACLLGMASKEVMVTAPLMVFLYDRTFVSGSFREAWKRHGRFYLVLAATWLLLGLLMADVHYRGVGYGGGITSWDYALTECRAVMNYLWLGFWPHPLVFDYGPNLLVGRLADVWLSGLILSLLLAGVLWALVRQPVIGFLGTWFFLILAPSSSVVPILGQPMAENRPYLSLAAVVVAVIVTGNWFCRNLWARRGWPEPSRVGLQVAVVIGLALALGAATIHRNAQYHSEESIWADVVAKRPGNVRSHASLGVALLTDGRAKESIPQFIDALHIDPNEPIVRCNLAKALAMSGATNQAIFELQETLRHVPNHAPAHVILADILAGQGDEKSALEQYANALAIDPDEQMAHFDLAQLLAHMGRREEAIAEYQKVLHLDPKNATTHYNLANLLAESGREEEAISHYAAATHFDPHNRHSPLNLGNLFLKMGRTNDAIIAYMDTLRVDPNSFKAHNNLAVILANRGDLVHATGHFREAARLMPGMPETHIELAAVLDQQGLHQDAQQERSEAQRLRGSSATP